jgi:hypothetical protein
MNKILIFIALLALTGGLNAFVGEGVSNVFEITETGVEGSVLPSIQQTEFTGSVYPNPFRSGTEVSISLQVKAGETAVCGIYNLAGQKVFSQRYASGNHRLVWDGRDRGGNPCASGIYLLRLSAPDRDSIAKLVLIR